MNYRDETVNVLYDTIVALENTDDCAALFEDLCTIKEIQDMAQRLQTALLLKRGENYQKITEKTGMSSATISRVSRCLNYGSGGYVKAIERIESKVKEEDK